MRFDKTIYFRTETEGEYDASTGNHADPVITEVSRKANVSDAGAEVLALIFADITQGALVIRIHGHYDEPFDYIRIGEKKYRVNLRRIDRHKEAFVCSEVQ